VDSKVNPTTQAEIHAFAKFFDGQETRTELTRATPMTSIESAAAREVKGKMRRHQAGGVDALLPLAFLVGLGRWTGSGHGGVDQLASADAAEQIGLGSF
jgi:hypothetical protein